MAPLKLTPSISEIENNIIATLSNTVEKDHTDYEQVDKELAKYIADARITISHEKNVELRRKIDRRILVVMILTYFLQAIDKGTMSFASIMGIKNDTHLSGQDYNWLTTCVFITILIVEYPQNYILSKVPIAKYMMNGAQQIVGGLLAYCFSLIKTGPLQSWKWLFLIYGVISIVFGLFVAWWMPDSPMRAKCFSEEDKTLMIERVRDNQTGIQNRKWKKYQFIEGLKDPQIWGYCLIQFCTTLPTSGLGAFQGIIIQSMGFTVLQTQLLAMVLGFYIIIVLLGSTYLAKVTNQNLYIMGAFVIPSFIGTICLMTVALDTKSQKIGLVVCYNITMSFWAAQTLALSLLSRNIAGQTKKSVAVALNFIFWATGNAIGPQVFLWWNAPRYFIAFATHLGCYTLLVIVIISLRFYLVWENKKRDNLAAAGVYQARDERMLHAWEDLTDKENVNFRYVF
ncbi:hypothetical protein ACHAPX_009830 [Trichoderma viride]